MVNNSDISGNKTRTTAKYKLTTDLLNEGLNRLVADQKYFEILAKSSDKRTRTQGINGTKATTIQIQRQKLAIKNDQMENESAFNRGEIYKFW